MTYDNANELKSVLALADQLGAKLPKRTDDTARHALSISLTQPTRIKDSADKLLEHLGDPKRFDAALPGILTEITHADATIQLRRQITHMATTKARQIMSTEGEAVTAAIAQKLAPHVEVLNKRAPLLPERFSPTDVDDLTADQFAAWRECEPAATALEQAASVLRPLFGVRPDSTLNHQVARRLPLIELPEEFETYRDAFKFIDAIDGVRQLGGELAAPKNDRATFWPARVLHAGGTIRIAAPVEARARADRLRAACVIPVKERTHA